ncbi:hypothetical protein [Streptomyces sp. 6-11-2]|uniref:hypothetical protein n=1 Tax=Streptomyces sp. 6-11-2 TaxID=2585753 RepID=UPI001142B5D7|nr:hypothetical protein [Streptomyces sp. 6-11-2]GED90438.1 hypothetical protein TNCT6_75230 [Streptomyces sp. 6-11-2]
MAQARAEGGFTATREAFCSAAKTKAGGHEGTRVLIEVLLSRRQSPAAAVVGGMQAVLGFDSVGINLVAIAARRCNATCEELGDSPTEGAKTTSRHARRPPPDPRPLADMTTYDRLPKPVTPHHIEEGHERMSPAEAAPTDKAAEAGFEYQVPPRRLPLPETEIPLIGVGTAIAEAGGSKPLLQILTEREERKATAVASTAPCSACGKPLKSTEGEYRSSGRS